MGCTSPYLEAQAKEIRAEDSSDGLFSENSASGMTGGLHASLLSTAPAGVYFAHLLGLAEGKRLGKLSRTCDVSWVLADRDILDHNTKLTARALRHDLLLLGPAAKNFVRDAVKDSAAWTELEREEYTQLQQRLRCGPTKLGVVSPL